MTPPPAQNVLEHWRCTFTWTPDAGTYTAKTITLHVNALDSTDALNKTQTRCAMHTGYVGSTYSFGTPQQGWIVR